MQNGNQKNASKPLFCLLVIGHADCFYYIFTNVVNTNAPDPAAWNAHYLMSMTTFSVMGSSITRHPHGSRTHPRLVDVHTRNASSRPHLFYRSNVGAKRHSYSFDHSNLLSRRLDQRRFFIPIGMVPVRIVGPAWLAPVSGDRDIDRDDEKVDTAAGISNVLYMGLAVCGGMWMPLEIMPKMMQNIGHWLPSYHYGSGAWEIARGQMPNWKNILFLLAYSIVIMLLSKYIRRKQEAV